MGTASEFWTAARNAAMFIYIEVVDKPGPTEGTVPLMQITSGCGSDGGVMENEESGSQAFGQRPSPGEVFIKDEQRRALHTRKNKAEAVMNEKEVREKQKALEERGMEARQNQESRSCARSKKLTQGARITGTITRGTKSGHLPNEAEIIGAKDRAASGAAQRANSNRNRVP